MIKKLTLALTILLISASPVWANYKVMTCIESTGTWHNFLLKNNKIFILIQPSGFSMNRWLEVKGDYTFSDEGIRISQNYEIENNLKNKENFEYRHHLIGPKISVSTYHSISFKNGSVSSYTSYRIGDKAVTSDRYLSNCSVQNF